MSITRWPERAALAALGLLLLAACGPPPGPARTESRSVETFHAVELRGAADVDIQVGKGPSLAVTAPESMLRDVEVTVRDGVLEVSTVENRSWFRRRATVKLAIEAPLLDALTLNGAGNIRIHAATGDKLVVTMQGAGNVEGDGQVGTLHARIDGAGNMSLAKLIATDAEVSVNGAGNMDVHATGSLNAQLNGVGSITYGGNPRQPVTSVRGVGSISPAGGK
jgi:hypothetical protein